MAKRLLCVILSIMLVVAMMPVGVVADEEVTYAEWTDSTSLPTSGTYMLTTDVTVSNVTAVNVAGEDLTLDLNGYTITSNCASTTYMLNISNGRTMTIEDSSEDSSGKVIIASGRGIYVWTSGTLVINGGNFYLNSSTVASDSLTYLIQCLGTLEINDGYFECNVDSYIVAGFCTKASGSGSNVNYSKPVITINGGEFVNNSNNGGVIYSNNYSTSTYSTITITGGTFTNTSDSGSVVTYDSYGTLTISGGTFTSANEDESVVTSGNNGTVEITGGSYSSDVSSYIGTGTYILSYADNVDTEEITVPNYQVGTSLTVSTDTPVRSGYTFSGWNTEVDGSGKAYAAGDSITISADTTLYAVWTADLADTWVEYTNVSNGYDLAIGFYIPKDKLDNTYTVKITANVATYDNGWVKTPTVTTIDPSDWLEDSVSGTEYWVVEYCGIWAMQYADEITVDIYDSNGDKVCDSYTDSIADYEARYIEKYSSNTDAVALARALVAYCSAAETYYGY